MHKTVRCALLALATLAFAGAADAAVTVTNVVGDVLAPGFTKVVDFDNAPAAGYSLSGTFSVFANSTGIAAAPPGDATKFAGLQSGQSLNLHSVTGFNKFSFYMGSPDSYNYVTVNGVTLNGSALMGLPFVASNGNQSVGRTVTYDLGGMLAHDVTFSSRGIAFEFDNIAVSGGVPEPITWALMISGFAMVGATLRRRRAVLLAG